jgi:hypothetical protein
LEEKKLFVLSMWKLTLGHGNWKYMISFESPGKLTSIAGPERSI